MALGRVGSSPIVRISKNKHFVSLDVCNRQIHLLSRVLAVCFCVFEPLIIAVDCTILTTIYVKSTSKILFFYYYI